MKQKLFVKKAVEKIKDHPNVLGLAVGGSWITNEIDEFSDIDLILVTEQKVSNKKYSMLELANMFGDLLTAFTGEHVGEPRLLICLYDNPLLHVDIKFVTSSEFEERIEDPEILWERERTLSKIIKLNKSVFPELDFQWIEDRFWTWLHYCSLKIGRGEYFETLEALSFLRMNVIAPLLQLKNDQIPRGVRKVEVNFTRLDLKKLENTVAVYNRKSIIKSLEHIVELYIELRKELYPESVKVDKEVQQKTINYFEEIIFTVL